MDAFKKYFNKSKKFGSLFYTNFGILMVLLLISFTRIVTGALRDKPVAGIVILTILLAIIIVVFLQRLTRLVCTLTIPNLYKNKMITKSKIEENWRWDYFLHGATSLVPLFIPLVNYAQKRNADGSSAGTSCGSGCGSSCGGGCGGCGGS